MLRPETFFVLCWLPWLLQNMYILLMAQAHTKYPYCFTELVNRVIVYPINVLMNRKDFWGSILYVGASVWALSLHGPEFTASVCGRMLKSLPQSLEPISGLKLLLIPLRQCLFTALAFIFLSEICRSLFLSCQAWWLFKIWGGIVLYFYPDFLCVVAEKLYLVYNI